MKAAVKAVKDKEQRHLYHNKVEVAQILKRKIGQVNFKIFSPLKLVHG